MSLKDKRLKSLGDKHNELNTVRAEGVIKKIARKIVKTVKKVSKKK